MPQAIIVVPADALEMILNGQFLGVIGRDQKLVKADEIIVKRFWYVGDIDPLGELYINIEHADLWDVCTGCEIPKVKMVMRYE